jgi:hypothetical protein
MQIFIFYDFLFNFFLGFIISLLSLEWPQIEFYLNLIIGYNIKFRMSNFNYELSKLINNKH